MYWELSVLILFEQKGDIERDLKKIDNPVAVARERTKKSLRPVVP